jgi:hypothetical protein
MVRREPDTRVVSVDRARFLADLWRYKGGEHVSLIGPTNAGKTWLSFQLLAKSATPALPAVVLSMKPRDDTVTKFARTNKFRIIPSWPPTPSIFHPRKPPGWVLWPRHTFDPDIDDDNHGEIFRRALLANYKQGDRIIFADEAYSLTNELGLGRILTTLWTKGRSMGAGLWAATQKPTHVPLWMYNSAEHLFLAKDPDVRAQKRFGEIGGVDPDLVSSVTSRLPQFHWLYIRRSDSSLCVVGP